MQTATRNIKRPRTLTVTVTLIVQIFNTYPVAILTATKRFTVHFRAKIRQHSICCSARWFVVLAEEFSPVNQLYEGYLCEGFRPATWYVTPAGDFNLKCDAVTPFVPVNIAYESLIIFLCMLNGAQQRLRTVNVLNMLWKMVESGGGSFLANLLLYFMLKS